MRKLYSFFVLLLLTVSISVAQDQEEEFADAPLPPELPDPLQSGQAIEPEVLITVAITWSLPDLASSTAALNTDSILGSC